MKSDRLCLIVALGMLVACGNHEPQVKQRDTSVRSDLNANISGERLKVLLDWLNSGGRLALQHEDDSVELDLTGPDAIVIVRPFADSRAPSAPSVFVREATEKWAPRSGMKVVNAKPDQTIVAKALLASENAWNELHRKLEPAQLVLYSVSIQCEAKEIFVTFTSVDHIPGSRGAGGSQRGFEATVNYSPYDVVRSNFMR